MKKKYLAKLLSVALSAAMAFTSVIPSYAMEGAEPDAEEPSEVVEETTEEEASVDELDEDTVIDAGETEDADAEAEDAAEEEAEEVTEEVGEEEFEVKPASEVEELDEDAELMSTSDTDVIFAYTDTHVKAYDPFSLNQGVAIEAGVAYTWDSSQDLTIEMRPDTGYVFADTTKITAKYSYQKTGDASATSVDMDSTNYSVTLDKDTQVATLFVPATFMSQLKALDTHASHRPTITVTAGEGTTKQVTFFAKVDHKTINIGADDAKLQLKYYAGDQTIIFTGKEFSYFPLTGVEVYLGEVKPENKQTASLDDTVTIEDPFYYTNKTVKLAGAFINKAYTDSKDITIVGLSDAFTVEQDATNKSAYGSKLVFEQATGEAGALEELADSRSTDYEKDLVVSAEHPDGNVGRKLSYVKYTVTYKDKTTASGKWDAEAGVITVNDAYLNNGGNKIRSIVAEGFYTDVIQYKATAAFSVKKSDEATIGTKVPAADGDADVAFNYETKKAASISIKPKADFVISKIEYKVGKSTTKKELTVTESGEYTIPADDMTNAITLYVTTAPETNQKIKVAATAVSPAAIHTDFVVTKYGTTREIKDSAYAAEVGKDFVFTVEEASHAYKVKSVTYLRNGSTYNATTNPGTAATVVDAAKGIYKIPAAVLDNEETLELYITGTKMVKVIVPKNPKAVVYVGSEAKAEDFYIESGKAFTFEVRGRAGSNDGDITLQKVTYKVKEQPAITDAATETKPVEGQYTISESAVNDEITITADTSEVAKSGTYSVKFEPDATAEEAAKVGIWAGEWKAGKDEANKLYANRSIDPTEVLYLARLDTTIVTPTVTYTKAIDATHDGANADFTLTNATPTVTAAGVKYEQVSNLELPAKVAVISKTSADTTGTIIGNQVGTESVKYTFVKDDAYSGEHNYVSISGAFAVEVKPHFEVTLSEADKKTILPVSKTTKDATNSDTKLAAAKAATDSYATITAKVQNNVTRKDISSTVLDANITWTASSTPWYVFKDKTDLGHSTSDRVVKVVAGAAASAKTFNVAVKDGKDANGNDIVFTAATPITLEAVDTEEIGVAAVIDIPNGARTWKKIDATANLDAAVLNRATITYKAYKVGKANADFDSWAEYTSEAAVATGLEKGYLTDITSQVTFAMDYYKTGSNPKVKEDGLTISGSAGVYTASATAKTNATVTMDVTCTYNKASYPAPNVEFTVNSSLALVNVPMQLVGTNGTTNKLSNAYLSGKTYSVGYEADKPTDGYLFKVSPGSQFTLPTENDLDSSIFKGDVKKVALVGWTVTPSAANAIHGDTSATARVYMPGTTIVIDKAITSVVPEWDNRYEVGTIYRNPSAETVDNVVYTNVLADDKIHVNAQTEKLSKPSNFATLTELTTGTIIPVGGEFEIGLPVTANIPYASGDYANITTSTEIKTFNDLYPEAATTASAGKIVWHAYDYATQITLNTTDATEKAALAKASEYVSFSGNKIKGLKSNIDTKTWVYATFTGDDANEYATSQLQIVVNGDQTEYTIDASKLLEVTDSSSNKSNKIEVGQTVTTTTANGLNVKEGLLDVVSEKLDPANGSKLIWTYDTTMLKIEDGAANLALPTITGLKQGTTAVKVQFVDKDGAKSNEASVNITVAEPAVRIAWTDKDGNAVTNPSAEVLAKGTATNLYFRLLDKAGNDVAGTIAVKMTSDNDKVIGDKDGLTATNNVYKVVGTAGSEFTLGSATITVEATVDGAKYSKDIEISNYATITFDLSAAAMATSATEYPVSTTLVPGDITDKAKTVISGVDGELDAETGDYVVKIFEDDLTKDGSYTVDLSKFTATYSGTDKAKVSFVGFAPTVVAVPDIKDSYEITTINKSNFALRPLFADAKITSVVTSVNSVVFDNLDATTVNKDIEVTVKPTESKATVSVTSSTSNSGTIDAFFYINNTAYTEDWKPTSTGDKLDLTLTNGKGSFSLLPITNKVGDTVLTVAAPGSDAKDTVALKVYGQYQDSTTKYRYVDAEGYDAVDTAVTFKTGATTTDTYYYDADGYKITDNRAAHDADGNLVLLAAGKLVTSDGLHTAADAKGNDFFTKDGIIQTGLIEVKGVQRYADTGTGALVTYAMTKVQGVAGKWTDTKSGAVYNIAEADNSAEADHKHSWTIKWDPWKVTDATATATITCSVGKETVTLTGAIIKTELAGGLARYDVSVTYGDETWSDTPKTVDASGNPAQDISGGEGEFVIVGLEEAYPYTGNAIQPIFQVIDTGCDATLAKGVDYTVKYTNNKNVGTAAQILVKGKGNYSGQAATATFEIYKEIDKDDAVLKGASIKLPKETHIYNGEAQYPSAIELKLKGGSYQTFKLEDGFNDEIPATITYSNNVNKGSATIALTGSDGTTIKKTFAIKALDMSANAKDFTVTLPEDTDWQVKGATPPVYVEWNGRTLIEGEDFTVKYANNKAIGTAASVTITGKNNFTKSMKVDNAYEITKFSLEDAYCEGATVYDGVKGSAVKVTLVDYWNNVIPANLLKVTVLKGETDMTKSKLVAGDEVTIKVEPSTKGTAVLEGAIELSAVVGANLNKASVKIAKGFAKQYTGGYVELTDDDMKNFTVTLKVGKEKKTLVYGEDFVIGGYSNNLKKGTMKVTLIGTQTADEERGIPAISGTKVVNVKITAKPLTKVN